MPRRLFTLASAVSLLLCLATIGLWVRSHFKRDWFQYWHTRWGMEMHSNYGELSADWQTTFADEDLGVGWGDNVQAADSSDLPQMPLGFGRGIIDSSDWQGRHLGQSHSYWFPHWAPALLFGLLPGGWFVGRMRRSGIARPGHCSKCGYDLRASKDKCPECGSAISEQPKVIS